MTIDTRDLHFRYATQDADALAAITVRLHAGDLTWLTGRVGSGTSTFLLVAAGLAPRLTGGTRGGEIVVAGADPANAAPIASGIGYLAASPSLQLSGVVRTVADEIAIGPMNLGLPRDEIVRRVGAAMDRLGVLHLAERDPARLSGGETQRVVLAALHAAQPSVWLLDEPFSALDHGSRLALVDTLQAIARDGATVVVATDDADSIALAASRVVVFERGQVVLDGAPREILETSPFGMIDGISTDAAHLADAAGLPLPRPLTSTTLIQRLDGMVLTPPHGGIAPTTGHSPERATLHLLDVDFRYSGGPIVLQGANLSVRAGEGVGIFGANGAGKSTLLRLAMALEHPSSGSVEILGRSSRGLHPEDFARHAGFLFQQPEQQLFASTVRAECRFAASMAGWEGARIDEAVHGVLEELGLAMFADQHPGDLALPLKRLVALASILVTRPELLLLDEPTAGLDRPSRQRVIDVVRRRTGHGLSTIAVTHDHLFAHEALDRAVLVDGGAIHEVESMRTVLDGSWLPMPAALAVARNAGFGVGNDRHQDVARSIATALGR